MIGIIWAIDEKMKERKKEREKVSRNRRIGERTESKSSFFDFGFALTLAQR